MLNTSTKTGLFSHVATEKVGPDEPCAETPADVYTATASTWDHTSCDVCAETALSKRAATAEGTRILLTPAEMTSASAAISAHPSLKFAEE